VTSATTATTGPVQRVRIVVTGTVQGVGFRPHVHRLATGLGLVGSVVNHSAGVTIEVEGPRGVVDEFLRRLRDEAPPLARLEHVATEPAEVRGEAGFAIEASTRTTGAVTSAPPDTAACVACLRDVGDPADRRYRYPFTTCTDCGPRFTIITALPYDRPATTMAGFPLCPPCEVEYRDPGDRRFHAQPLACPDCGPRLRLVVPDDDEVVGRREVAGSDEVLLATQRRLLDGAIVAVKGVGGFHLACRADDEATVTRLRARKHRPGKPLALVVRDLEVAGRFGTVGEAEAAVLASPAAPIVLLRRRADAPLADAVAPGVPHVGVMLPASPLHHLLLADVPGAAVRAPEALVLTSGNLADEPLCTDDAEARDRLGAIADAFLVHDRPIAVPCDDSVVRVDDDADGPVVTFLRRSRGYVPTPVELPAAIEPALAVGGELKTTACLGAGRHAWLSAHIGDMGSLASLRAFERTVERFASMHEVVPTRLLVDAHPDHTTHRWALAHADGRPVVPVQHHHAHVASVMAEHRVPPGTAVLGFAFDGTGYGSDGTIWGGEALLARYDGFERVAHLRTVPLPGGDAAIRAPHRVALSHLRSAGVAWTDDLAPVAATSLAERRLLAAQLDRGVRCVPTSSVGRLFDAVASLLDLRHTVTYEAQAALELEAVATACDTSPAPLRLPVRDGRAGPMELDGGALVRELVAGRRAGRSAAASALGFHRALAEAVAEVAARVRARGGPDLVALSGGVFTNALLTRLTVAALEAGGATVLRHRLVPPGDGGLALGQLVVGAAPATTHDDGS
jgi:hydrogenase maturation protein HypF